VEPDEHRYRIAWWLPPAWMVVGTLVGSAGGQRFVGALVASCALALGLTAISRLGVWQLVTSPRGLRYRGREVRWSQLSLVRTRWRTVLRTSGLALKESVVIPPRTYFWRWEQSPLADDLRRWAPHLLDPTAPTAEEPGGAATGAGSA
jgi:hypothetical protein